MLPGPDKYVNIHAHRRASSMDEWVLTNVLAQDYPPDGYEDAQYSVGLHPWHIEGFDVELLLKKVQLATENIKVLALGETGLDKAIKTPMKLQLQIFEAQVELAEHTDLALIIHAVKSFNELKDFVKVHQPHVPMIIHGFRGGTRVAEEMIKAGFYLSLGSPLLVSATLAEVAAMLPLEKLFLESDEDDVEIQLLYKRVAEIRGISKKLLRTKINENATKILQRQVDF